MPISNICYCFLFCLTSKVDLTSFMYIIDTSGILIYFLYRLSCPFSVGFPAFFSVEWTKSLALHAQAYNTPHNRLKFILKGHSYFYTPTLTKYFFDFLKVHIFWEGHKILQNLHLTFVPCSNGQINGGDFAKFCGLLRLYELYYSRYFMNISWNQIFKN